MTDYSYPFRQRILSALRKSPVKKIRKCLEIAKKYDLEITAAQLEAHHLAGGRITDVVDALVLAKQRGLRLPLLRAFVQDLCFGKTRSVPDWVADCDRRGVKDLEREPLPA